jgi:UDP-N-acetylglucosamine transferase subunit ALG13
LILVLLGTHELPFTRLIKEVERLKLEGIIDDDIIVQNGNTKFESEVLTLKPFVSFEEMDRLVEESRLIITHAGTGSIISGLKKKKIVIAAPRLAKYNEHNDDHQLELAEVFEEQGHILVWRDGEKLEDVLKKVEAFEPKPFVSKKEKMLNLLQDFIDSI